MIDYINKRLEEWARWRVSDRALVRHALGVKNCWPQMLKDDKDQVKLERHGTLVPFNDLDCCEMDRAVCALPVDLKLVVTEVYCRVGTTESVARRCGVSRMTLHRRLDRAHWLLLGWLNDIAAGAELAQEPTLAQKIACAA